MHRWDASTATCVVYTFKEGLLSAVAHDLLLDVTRFRIEVDGEPARVVATFDTGSLRVRCAMKNGAESPGTLSAEDRRDIDERAANEVLEARRHREIRFVSESVGSEGEGFRVRGRLEIKGVARAVEFRVVSQGARLVGDIPLRQPDFGIKPYSAMLGTLKIRPEIRVRVDVPAPSRR